MLDAYGVSILGLPSLFLPSNVGPLNNNPENEKSQLLEVQHIAPDTNRSWFLEDHVVSDGKMVLLTPIDPVFVLIPILRATLPSNPTEPSGTSTTRFRTIDDLFEEASTKLVADSLPREPSFNIHHDSPVRKSRQNSVKGKERDDRPLLAADIMSLAGLECVKRALRSICDTKDVTGDIAVYRYSEPMLMNLLRAKVARLEAPEVFHTFRILARGLARSGLDNVNDSGVLDSSAAAGDTTRKMKLEALAAYIRVGLVLLTLAAARQKAACDLVSQYLPPDLYSRLLQSYDFTALDEHTNSSKIEDLAPEPGPKKKAAGTAKGNEAAGGKKVKAGSRGVEALKKADTAGMSKLSTFFKKKEEVKG
ncbi:hypothetical protein BS47DRAFT_1358345 [Hydnum rufescens UP504]|uniref:Ribonuclease H2 subunit B n=1 Tax=Hydnum rufescens UP504 TaxID=1448309 RepID=A0A9P6B816_9AGAM|nr:hypothetical protein BS47DRAFT_1358345 [Hydnum rufescens UP504]